MLTQQSNPMTSPVTRFRTPPVLLHPWRRLPWRIQRRTPSSCGSTPLLGYFSPSGALGRNYLARRTESPGAVRTHCRPKCFISPGWSHGVGRPALWWRQLQAFIVMLYQSGEIYDHIFSLPSILLEVPVRMCRTPTRIIYKRVRSSWRIH